MKTRAVAVVHSHIRNAPDNGVINLSDDVISVDTQKSVKGPGAASLLLVPRRNYFNLIFPNDVINIYFDPGDGKRGFVRTFFGYVDRVERSVTTDDKGATSTSFRVTCTDLTKVFDRTDIYFNPNLSNRADFLETRFGQSQLGGHALRTRGIRAHGTPSDMIENLATLLLGFGAQWVLPESYKNSATGMDKLRAKRLQRTKARITAGELNRFAELGGDINKLDSLEAEIQELTDKITEMVKNGQTSIGLIQRELSKKREIADLLEGSATFAAWKTAVSESGAFAYTVLDLLDMSFIEAMTIDGYIASTSIWQKQGSLASLMYGYSNEVVNELFFDLRPTMIDEGEGLADTCFGDTYSTEPDELGINVDGLGHRYPASVPAVRYTPAIVMREYPYSTSEGIDLKNLFVSDVGGTYGFVPFGPVFSTDVNPPEPTRAIYDYNTVDQVRERGGLSPNVCLFEPISRPLKHLDVIPIRSQDVKEDTLGRSDNDVYNMIALYAADAQQKSYKYLLQDLFPIMTPVSIERNGLRTLEETTTYANYSQDQLCGKGSGIDNAAIRQNLTRWAFLLDHWNQHNNEYLSGDMTLRGMPEIRVGYRLDHLDRHESYYVEEVKHQWKYPDAMMTTVTVSRGQRNDPMPAYIPPAVSRDFGKPTSQEDRDVLAARGGLAGGLFDSGFSPDNADLLDVATSLSDGGGDRSDRGRLGKYFRINPTYATATSTQNTPEDRVYEDENHLDKLHAIISGKAEYSAQEVAAVTSGFAANSTEMFTPEELAAFEASPTDTED